MFAATKCQLSRDAFLANARPHTVVLGGVEYHAEPKVFSTGSFGWNLTTKINVTIDGVSVKVQVGLNMTVVGSREAV